MGAPIKPLELSEEETTALILLAASGTTQQRMAVPARVVLSAADGLSLQEISKRTGLSDNACLKWRKRFASDRFEGLADESGRGRPQSITQEQRLEVMAFACTKPLHGSTRWSMRKLADTVGYSVSTIHEILNAGALKPHKVRHGSGTSPDPRFTSNQTTV